MKRPLIALTLVLAAASAQAQTRFDDVPRLPAPQLAQNLGDLGPRSEPVPSVALAVARTQIEKSGYSSVRGLQRGTDGSWHARALDSHSAPVTVILDSQGKVTQAR
jgi:hypothetical protein